MSNGSQKGQQKALNRLYTLEELTDAVPDQTSRREKVEDKVPVRWIPVKEKGGLPLLHFKSRILVTFSFSWFFPLVALYVGQPSTS